MTRRLYACDYCKGEYVSPLAAAFCCDIISNELDEHPRVIYRGID